MTRTAVHVIHLSVLLVWPAVLVGAAEGTRPVEIYEPPVLVTRVPPPYPASAQARGEEGWVELQLMVGTDGKPYEVTVTDSMGMDEFSVAAVRAVKRWKFDAARMDGQTLDASTRFRLQFVLESGKGGKGEKGGVRKSFSRRFESIKTYIDSNERAKALELLEQEKTSNLYEDVFLQVGWFLFYVRWGTPEQQRIALTRATASDPDFTRVPVRFTQMLALARFSVELQTSHFGAALKTLALIDRLQEKRTMRIDAARKQSMADARKAIEELKSNDTAFSVGGTVGDHANWVYSLLKDEMSFEVHEGEIAELKLRCEKRFVGFRFAEHSTFKIPSSYGACELEVIGNPGTTFTLTQS